jgi:predicted transglutaminase-like cysteine proteinase
MLVIAFLFIAPGASYAAPKPPVQITVPIDVDDASRVKFPLVDGDLIDRLAFVNKFVNASMTYEGDYAHYGDDEKWVMSPADGKGDCEDYALTKLRMILDITDINEMDTKIVGVTVHYKELGIWRTEGHAILAVRLPDQSRAYLDLNNDELMTKTELSIIGPQGPDVYYEFTNSWAA